MVVCKYEVSCLRLLVGYLVERSKRNSIFTRAHVLFTISSLGRDEAELEDFLGGRERGGVTQFSGRIDGVAVVVNSV